MTDEGETTFVRLADLRRNAKKTNVLTDVRNRLLAREAASVFDEHTLRHQEDWSFLSNQIVGAEDRANYSD